MTRAIPAVLAAVLAGPSLPAGAAGLAPQDFAYAIPITTPAPAAAYRLAVPLEVYRNVLHDDLRDLRVFNARGEAVPYELQEPPPTPVAERDGTALPLFPLRRDARIALDGLRISVQSNGTAVNVQTTPGTKEASAISGYVIDARGLEVPLAAFQLHWQEGVPDFSASLRVESSDDLATWRIVRNDAPVLNLRAASAQLVQSRLDVPSSKAKFWRLTWLGKIPPLELSSVTAVPVMESPAVVQSNVTVLGTSVNDKRREFAFDLGARLPITQINIGLPQQNSVVRLQILSRARATDTWRQIGYGEFYRVGNAGSERRNPPIVVPRNSDRFWLARLDQTSGAIADGSPSLEATWNAQDVVFLAQGSGPFLLAYGSTRADAAGSALAPLLKDVTVLRAQPEAPRSLGGAARLRPGPREFPWRVTILWGVLGLGVVLLAYMAYRLSRELGSSQTDSSKEP